MIKRIILIILCLFVFIGLGSCAEKSATDNQVEDLREKCHTTADLLANKNVGVMYGTPQEENVKSVIKNPSFSYYETLVDEAIALSNRKIDCFTCVEEIFNSMQDQFKDLISTDLVFGTYSCGIIFTKDADGDDLKTKMNAYLTEITDNGTLQSIKDYWLSDGQKEGLDLPKSGTNGTLTCGISSAIKPYSYYIDGKNAGMDIAIIKGFCEKYGYGVVFEDTNYNGIVSGVVTGKYDLSTSIIAYTAERASEVLFSDLYYTYNMVGVLRRDSYEMQDNSILYVPLTSLKGTRAGILNGTPHGETAKKALTEVDLLYYQNNSDCCMALRENKIDFAVNNTIQYNLLKDEYPEFGYLSELFLVYQNGAIFPKTTEGAALRDEYNAYLQKITDDGTLKELEDYWLYPNDWEPVDYPTTGSKIIKMATSTTMKPFSIMIGTKYGGYDIAIMAGFCKEYGYGLQIDDGDFNSVVAGITENKYDVAAGQVAYTPTRAENVYYSTFNSHQDVVAIVRVSDFVNDSTMVVANETLFEKIKSGFQKTFIDENRWEVILNGLKTTMIISICGFILANILGGLFCAMTMSKSKILRAISDVYSRIMQGTPIVVILMILYYVIFGNSNLSGIIISIIGFGLSIGAYISQIFYGSIKGIDKGQNEAALTLGFTKVGAFINVILPQAIRTMLPAYFSQFISLMKGTAIVGYIAVLDLTRASDIIRSNTYRAFFPLISTALIYFIISSILLSILKLIQKALAPKRKSDVGGDK